VGLPPDVFFENRPHTNWHVDAGAPHGQGMTDYTEVSMCMGPKRALVVLAMAHQGPGVSASQIVEAEQVSGVHFADLRPGRQHPYLDQMTYEDDEDLSDVENLA